MERADTAGEVTAAPVASRLLRTVDGIALALSAALCAALAFLAVNQPWVSDDFSGAIFLREHPGLWDTLSYGYQTWTGRFSSSIFSWSVLQYRPAYGVLLWLALLSLVVMTFALARGRFPKVRRADLYVLGVVLAAYWYGLPALEETVFWTAGSIVYLWPAVLTLLFLYPYRLWTPETVSPRVRHVPTPLSAAAMLVLGTWVGGSQEQVLVAGVAFLFLVGVRAARAGKLWRLPAHLYTGAAGLVIAGAVSLNAPGNGERLAEVPGAGLVQTAIAAAKYAVHIAVDWLPPLAPWLLILGLLAVPAIAAARSARADDEPQASTLSGWWVWLLLGAATVSPLLVQPYFGAERTIMFLAVFLVVAVVSLGNDRSSERVLEHLPAAAASAVLAIVLLTATCDVALSGWQAKTLKAAQEQRAELVAQQKADGVIDVRVPKLTDEVPRRGVIWGDGTADPAFWVNGVMASWYGVNTLVVTEVPGVGYGAEQ